MKVLVTGAGGFVGRHLLRELSGYGHSVVAFDVAFPQPPEYAETAVTGDIRDADAVDRLFVATRPDACVHLAAVSFVPSGENTPERVLSVNVGGTRILLEAVRQKARACRVLLISSSQVYGPVQSPMPIPETAPLAPVTLYAASKVAAEALGEGYARHHGLRVIVARPTNHTGPGQSELFALSSFVAQIRRIREKETPPVLLVGNLESERPVLDVRDVVRAYRCLAERGEPGQVYNVSPPHRVRMGQALDWLCELAGIWPECRVDAERFRETDHAPVLNSSRIRRLCGWEPEYDLRETLRAMLSNPTS